MTDAPLCVITSPDGTSFSKPQNIVNGYSDYGMQMAVYRGELYGIMTQTVQYPKQLFATKYKIGEGWKAWKSLPSKFLSQGRVSVTTLNDRFFIFRRGTDNGAYLTWTDNFEDFVDVGRIGSQYAKTMVSPAICAYDGQLYMVGVGPDKYIYYCTADQDGQRQQSWKKIEGTGTQSALALAVFNGKLYLFHTGWDNDKFFYQSMGPGGTTWSKLMSANTNITSGIAACSWKYDELVITYRGKDDDIKMNAFDGKKWMGKTYVPDVMMRYQCGLATWGGRLVISYSAAKSSDRPAAMTYRSPIPSINEKDGAFGEVREVDSDEEWNCKWNVNDRQMTKSSQKGWIKKMLCL